MRGRGAISLRFCLVLSVWRSVAILVSIGLVAPRSDKRVVVTLGSAYAEVNDACGVDVDA